MKLINNYINETKLFKGAINRVNYFKKIDEDTLNNIYVGGELIPNIKPYDIIGVSWDNGKRWIKGIIYDEFVSANGMKYASIPFYFALTSPGDTYLSPEFKRNTDLMDNITDICKQYGYKKPIIDNDNKLGIYTHQNTEFSKDEKQMFTEIRSLIMGK